MKILLLACLIRMCWTCDTFACIKQIFNSKAHLNIINESSLVFGPAAQDAMTQAYDEIHFLEPDMRNTEVSSTSPIQFKVVGEVDKPYMHVLDPNVEIIVTAEQDGWASIATGLSFAAHHPKVKDLFKNVVSDITQGWVLPELSFLVGSSNVGIVTVARVRTSSRIAASVAQALAHNPVGNMGFENDILTKRSFQSVGTTIYGRYPLQHRRCDGLWCSFLRFVLPAAVTHLEFLYELSSQRIIAQVSNIQLSRAWVLRDAGLFVAIDQNTSIGMLGDVQVQVDETHPPLTFGCELSESSRFTALDARLSMKGVWENAFGWSFLKFGNVQGEAQMVPEKDWAVDKLALGAELGLGPIQGAAYLGLDIADPSNNYFYAHVKNLTLQDMITFIAPSVHLPPSLGRTGLQPLPTLPAVLVSFAHRPIGIRNLDHAITIQQGWNVQGTLDFLGASMSTNLTVDVAAKYVHIDFTLSPISLVHGWFKLYASPSSPTLGPYFYVHADYGSSASSLDVRMAGYVDLLGVSIHTNLTLTSATMWFRAEFKLWKLFKSINTVTVDFKSLNVHVSGALPPDSKLMGQLTDETVLMLRDVVRRHRRLRWWHHLPSFRDITHAVEKKVMELIDHVAGFTISGITYDADLAQLLMEDSAVTIFGSWKIFGFHHSFALPVRMNWTRPLGLTTVIAQAVLKKAHGIAKAAVQRGKNIRDQELHYANYSQP